MPSIAFAKFAGIVEDLYLPPERSRHAETVWGMTDPQIQRNLRHTTIRTSKQHYRHADIPNLRAIGSKVSFGPSPALGVVG